MHSPFGSLLETKWVQNEGPSCTTAAILAALGALAAQDLPDLRTATVALAGAAFSAPALDDYLSLPRRRAPLDPRIEALARAHGLRIRSRTGVVVPGWPLRPPATGALIVHLAWGQERPGHHGSWGWRPLHPPTYATGGHSVVLAALEGAGWIVSDPNHERLQHWPQAGIAMARTLLLPG